MTCKSCKHWNGIAQAATALCRFNAPVVGDHRWPYTYDTDICGQHEDKPNNVDIICNVCNLDIKGDSNQTDFTYRLNGSRVCLECFSSYECDE